MGIFEPYIFSTFPLPLKSFLFPFPFPWKCVFYSHSHGIPMGIPFPRGIPFPCTPLLVTMGDRAFPVAGSRLWNNLPFEVTSAPTLPVFSSRLKTYLFQLSFPPD